MANTEAGVVTSEPVYSVTWDIRRLGRGPSGGQEGVVEATRIGPEVTVGSRAVAEHLRTLMCDESVTGIQLTVEKTDMRRVEIDAGKSLSRSPDAPLSLDAYLNALAQEPRGHA